MKTFILFLFLGLGLMSCSKSDTNNDTKVLENVIDLSTFDSKIASGVSIVFFHATWCSKCAAQRPAVEGLTKDTELNDVYFAQVDYEKNQDIRTKYKVSGFPTILIFKDGVEVHDLAGTGHSQQKLTDLLIALL